MTRCWLCVLTAVSGWARVITPGESVADAISRLAPGETLYLRGGTYPVKQIDVAAAGITIRNYEGERPVLDGGYAEFRRAGNADWEAHDTARNVYRSVKTYPGARAVFGYFGGMRLVSYSDYADLSAVNEDYAEAPHYFGPGVFWNPVDAKIYVRLNAPDPRRTPMILFSQSVLLRFTGRAANIRIEGIELRYQNTALEFQSGAHHITIANCTIAAGQYHVILRAGSHDLTFDHITDIDAFPPWVAWSDVKNWNRPGRRMQAAAFEIEAAYNIEIVHSTIEGGFDGIDAIHGPHHVRIHHNRFLNNRDDAVEIGSSAYEFEVADNFMLCGVACVSRTGSGEPPAGKAGTKYIHHNVMDASRRVRFGRHDPHGLLASKYHGPEGDGMNSGRAFGSHTMSAVTGPDPWKIYQNTIKLAPDMDHGGAGASYPLPAFDRACPQEVYNNIFIQTGDQWIVRDARDDGAQVFAGNLLYWTKGGPRGDPELDGEYRPSARGPAVSGFIDLSRKGWPGLRGEQFQGALATSSAPPR